LKDGFPFLKWVTMRKYLLLLILLSGKIFALNIHQVTVSPISNDAINISLTTEAAELYYFYSAQHTISGNTIEVDFYFVYGFGSTISYLNNNFEIPFDNGMIGNYVLTVKAYYIDLPSEHAKLQDEVTANFSMPLSGTIVLETAPFEITPDWKVFPNPTIGKVYFPEKFNMISVYDSLGTMVGTFTNSNTIDLGNFADGLYFFVIERQKKHKAIKVLLKK
jgi:hypothetical protein